jgi:hypothetical protein
MAGGSALVFGLMFVFTLFIGCAIPDSEKRGQFGDQFGAINALFSGLAFLGLIVTIAFQTRDLRLQTEALQLQIKEFSEQKEETKRSAEAQEMANRLKATELWFATRRMRIDIAIKNADSEPTEAQKRVYLKSVIERVKKIEDGVLRDLVSIGYKPDKPDKTGEGS